MGYVIIILGGCLGFYPSTVFLGGAGGTLTKPTSHASQLAAFRFTSLTEPSKAPGGVPNIPWCFPMDPWGFFGRFQYIYIYIYHIYIYRMVKFIYSL